jgi:hypothetical protein
MSVLELGLGSGALPLEGLLRRGRQRCLGLGRFPEGLAFADCVLVQPTGEALADADDEDLMGGVRVAVVDLIERAGVAGNRERMAADGEVRGGDVAGRSLSQLVPLFFRQAPTRACRAPRSAW